MVRHILSTAARSKHEQLNSWLASLVVAHDDSETGGRLSDDEMTVILDRCELVRYEEGEWIVPSALARDHVFIVREGHVIAQRKSGEPTVHEPTISRQRPVHRCAVDEQFPLDAGSSGPKQLLGVGAVFVADNVLFPSMSPTLPRRPSPIPMPAATVASPSSQSSAHPRRKRGRDDSSSLSSSSLSTIYEHGEVIRTQSNQSSQSSQDCAESSEDSGARKQQRRQSVELCQPSPAKLNRSLSNQSSVSTPSPQSPPSPLLSVSPSLLTRAASSPAVFPTSPSAGGLWVVCGSRECSVVGVPLDVLVLNGMERVRQWVVSRLVQ